MAAQRGLILRRFLLFFAQFWPCFSPRTLYFVALRTLLRMSLIFQRSLPTPLSSQKRSPTPQINTQFGFFHSSPPSESKLPPLRRCGTLHLFLTTFDRQLFEPVGIYWQDLFGQRDATEAVWMQSQLESSALSSPRKHAHLCSNRHQAAAVHHKQDPGLARHDQNSSSLSSSSCSPSPPSFLHLLLGASSDTEMTNPSPSVWDIRRHNTST
ncbi:uncharacterized protein LOC111232863 [Seriola dumerili]|uniref:uncharacterized protein LOC111232863 n=1 Tax=Seriola dumerili TaxID=41447 RepID=UPI000BBEEB71|nr:uncharacterized protein LOC111232863 [Seriola dumerili]